METDFDEELEVIMTILARPKGSRVRIETSTVFEDPFAWGIILVDAIRILADAYTKDEGATDVQPYIDRIKEGLDAEFKNYTSPIEFTGPVQKG